MQKEKTKSDVTVTSGLQNGKKSRSVKGASSKGEKGDREE
jgi:hypothetical protein